MSFRTKYEEKSFALERESFVYERGLRLTPASLRLPTLSSASLERGILKKLSS